MSGVHEKATRRETHHYVLSEEFLEVVQSLSKTQYLKMSRIVNQLQHRDSELAHSSESGIKISPAVLLVIVILSAIFFIYGILHILFKFFVKRPSFSSVSQSTRYNETSSSSHSLPRQLQQLFRIHDSGLDQSVIDALPVFYYKDITGLKEPFDCAVCLCEFSAEDTLRLIPTCSHAFHSNCIDTWLLSSSTCPLCRATLSSDLTMENPLFDYNGSGESLSVFSTDMENEICCDQKVVSMRKDIGEKRVLSVRLGKFRSLNIEGKSGERNVGEMGGCHLDARRCFSMRSSQYVVDDSDLQVAFFNVNADSAIYGDMHGKKICRVRGESFSVSKIWLWSRKGEVDMPMTNRNPVK